MISKRKQIYDWLIESGGKTSAEVTANLDIPLEHVIRELPAMMKRGHLTRVEAGLNCKNVMTYRYFAVPGRPPVGKGNFERKPRIAVRVIGERRYKHRKVQTASIQRQAMARSRFETQPIVRLP